jgi:alkylation response protein AidB-like acyl-CoA dehydrogenase
MDFSYREEQLEVQALAEKILGDQTSNERQKQVDAQPARFDEKLWQDLAAAGLLGVAVEEASGGMDFDFESLCLLVEEAGRCAAALPLIPALVSAVMPLQRWGGSEQKLLLSQVVSGEVILTAALTEPGNEDPLCPVTRAEATHHGWLLKGCKTSVPYARQAESVLLSACCEGELMVFLVALSSDGITLRDQQSTASEPQAELDLEAVEVADTALLARGAEASSLLHWLLQITRAAMAAYAVGLCDRMTRMSAEYTSQREQFGVPVATFQAVGHRAADCFIDVECLRLVTQEAISRLTLGLDASESVLVAKAWTGDVCHRVSQAAQHLHGGIGVDRDYPLHRYCLMARQIELTSGSTARLVSELGAGIARNFRNPM